MKKLLLIIFSIGWIFASPLHLCAQDGDLELAEYYYNQGQFEQAKLYYEKIYKSNQTNRVYNNYLNTLIALNDFEQAEKIAKKKVKDQSKDAKAIASLGAVYKKFNKTEQAKEQFEEAIKKVEPTQLLITSLAREFENLSEFDFALRTLEKGKIQGKDGYNYAYEIANMRGNLGDLAGMTESLLDLVESNPANIQLVQNTFNRTLNLQDNPANVELLRTSLLRRVQKNPDANPILNELLLWLFLQKKDFAAALVQATALDKRQNESGNRVMNLGDLARKNEDFSTAIKAYQYVIDKGPLNDHYLTAKVEKLQTMKDELVKKPGIDIPAYQALETAYETTLTSLGQVPGTAMLMKELAHLKAFYLQKTDEAISLLEAAIQIPGLYGRQAAVCKLELGDVKVFKGDVWDASLLFSQVELDYKEDVLGHEAKFRNARISYYSGDFEWAQGQLDVLKASTTKLISNDAIDLSLLITDNFNMDTITAPMEMFARADLLAYQNRFKEATTTLDSISNAYPMHSLMDEIWMLRATMAYKQADYDSAKTCYEKIIDLYFADILADDAMFKLAEMYETLFDQKDKAMALYERLITEQPASLYVIDARKRFRALRGDSIN
jgi:tetratricopeptide (TPR) repeat protein